MQNIKNNNDDESCYPTEIFIDQNAIKKCLCPIDYGVCRDPVFDPCGHTFGKLCINKWILKKNTCPLTNTLYVDHVFFPGAYTIKEILNELNVKCLNFEKNCTWNGILEQLEFHIKKECGFEIISCENNECDKTFYRINLEYHLKDECQHTIIDCPFKTEGCEKTMPRLLLSEHLGKSHEKKLRLIIENYDKNDNSLKKYEEIISEQKLKLNDKLENFIEKNEYYKILDSNLSLKQENEKLCDEVKELEQKVKETCLMLLQKEKEFKLLQNDLSSQIKNNNDIMNINDSNKSKTNKNTTNTKNLNSSKTLLESQTLNGETPPTKKQHTDFNPNFYNYPPQSMVYNPITGHEQIQNNYKTVQIPQPKPNTCDQKILDIPAHDNSINYLLLLPISDCRKYLASCSEDKTIKIWDLLNYQLANLLQGHVEAVTCLLYIKEAEILVSGGNDNMIRLWDVNSWDCLKFIDNKTRVRCLLNYSNPCSFLTGDSDKKIKLWTNDKGHKGGSNYSYETLANLNSEVSAMDIIDFGEVNEILGGDVKGNIYYVKDDSKKKGKYFYSVFSKILFSKKCHLGKVLSLKYLKDKSAFISCSLSEDNLQIRNKLDFQLITEIPICSTGYCINDIKYNLSAKLVIIGTSDERICMISSVDWNIKKSIDQEGFSINNIENDLSLGYIYSSGALRDKKDGIFKYIIRIRKL